MIINLSSVNWGPQFFVPTVAIKQYCGCVLFRGNLNEELLKKELKSMNLEGYPKAYAICWYIRHKRIQTWIKIGESFDRINDFGVRLDTAEFEEGTYQILGFLSVTIHTEKREYIVSRQSITDFEIKH